MQLCALQLGNIEHTRSYNSWIPLGGVVNSFKHCLRSAQKCSMWFKFGDCACYWRSWNGCDANHSCTILLTCLRSLTCWKSILFGSVLYFYIVDHKKFSKINLYKCLFILPFNFLPRSQPKSHHTSPNYHRLTTMPYNLMDVLRSNAISISNPTPWPIYLCLVVENHTIPIINGPILISLNKPQACDNMFTTQNWFPLLQLCTYCNLSQNTSHNDVKQQFTSFRSKLFCCRRCSSKSTFGNKSDTTPNGSSLGLQEALDTLLFVSQTRPLHPSSDVLQKIGSCPLKRQLCK